MIVEPEEPVIRDPGPAFGSAAPRPTHTTKAPTTKVAEAPSSAGFGSPAGQAATAPFRATRW